MPRFPLNLLKTERNVTNCTSWIICKSVYEHSNTMRTISFIGHCLIVTLIFTHRILMARSMLSFGIFSRFAVAMIARRRGIRVRIWTATLYSNGNLFTNLCEGSSHVSPTLHLCGFTIFKCSSHRNLFVYVVVFGLIIATSPCNATRKTRTEGITGRNEWIFYSCKLSAKYSTKLLFKLLYNLCHDSFSLLVVHGFAFILQHEGNCVALLACLKIFSLRKHQKAQLALIAFSHKQKQCVRFHQR